MANWKPAVKWVWKNRKWITPLIIDVYGAIKRQVKKRNRKSKRVAGDKVSAEASE